MLLGCLKSDSHPLVTSTAINQDGRSANLTSPNGPAQQRVIARALELAWIHPTSVASVEAHGTGTALGDPIEVGAQEAVLNRGRMPRDMFINCASKSVFGHMELGAGILSVLKTVATVQTSQPSPNLHFKQFNPNMNLYNKAVFVTGCIKCPFPIRNSDHSFMKTAGVSSFGYGGTNSHATVASAVRLRLPLQLIPTPRYCHKSFVWFNEQPVQPLIGMSVPGVSTAALEAGSGTQWERSGPSTTCSYMAQPQMGHSQKVVTAGIVTMEYYAPTLCCSVADIEQLHNCPGRYTVGRGQQHIGFTNGNEDTVSMAMTVFEKLVERCELPLTQIGRLEVGTESQVDRAKSVKSFLMAFFQDEALHNVEGTDTYNACYGGTNALFSTVNWVQSASWSGQYGVVVCSDPAVHPQPEALSGIGASAVGLMVGAEQVMMLEATRISFIKHSW